MRGAVVLAAGILALAGCAADGTPTPEAPDTAEAPRPGSEGGGHTISGEPLPPPLDPASVPPGWGTLEPARDGEQILAGVALLGPALDAGGAATFRVRNGSGKDLPDLILAVIFGVPSGETPPRHLPVIESIEAPMARGEERDFRVAIPERGGARRPDVFRVAAGLPEMLTAREEDGSPGTTFLGGLLECVRLETDLTSESPRVTVGLAERGPALPPLEARLFLARGGTILWSGSWILLPGATGGSRERGVTWRVPADLPAAGSSLYLRVREKR